MSLNIERYRGALLAGLYGDVIGSKYEWMPAYELNRMFDSPSDVFKQTSIEKDALYTDDTQMTICVAESLLEDQCINSENLAQLFYKTYEPWRGYGRGTRAVMNAMGEGQSLEQASLAAFSEGSYGNGSAMRVAPIGLRFSHNFSALKDAAANSSVITHSHRLGIEAAIIMAAAIAYMVSTESFNPDDYWGTILDTVESDEFRVKLLHAQTLNNQDELIALGSEINALESLPTALACAALYHDNLIEAIGSAILIGGDTDTVGAMAGSLVGALQGPEAIPKSFIEAVDRDNKKGANYLIELADKLFEAAEKD